MDTAVALVETYLRINGFFTVTEYPVVARERGGTATLTDVDVLAVRFPGAERWVPERGRSGAALATDPELGDGDHRLQMIIGEVKEGPAKVNKRAYSAPVVEAVIRRFGCCSPDPAGAARAVIKSGSAETHLGMGMGCMIRMIAFGGKSNGAHRRYDVISLNHIVDFLLQHLDQHRDVFLHTQIKDEILDLLALLVKLNSASTWGRAGDKQI